MYGGNKSEDLSLRVRFLTNQKITMIVSSIIFGLMMSCVGITAHYIWEKLPFASGNYFPLIFFIISIEAVYSQRKISGFTHNHHQKPIFYRFSEIILILLFVRIIIYIFKGIPSLNGVSIFDFSTIVKLLFDSEYYGSVVLTLAIWGGSILVGRYLIELENDEKILNSGFDDGFRTNRGEIQRRLSGYVMFVGCILVIMTTILTMESDYLWGDNNQVNVNHLNVIFYFILSLFLLSLGRFSVLRAGWGWQRIQISSKLSNNWIIYSLIFLVLLGFIIFLLPTGYSLGLLETFRYFFDLLLSLLGILFFVIFYLPIYLISIALNRLFPDNFQGTIIPPLFRVPEFPAPTPPSNTTTVYVGDLIKSVIFWIIFLIVIGYAFYQYFLQNQALMNSLLSFPGIRWIINKFEQLFKMLNIAKLHLSEFIDENVNNLQKKFFSGKKQNRIRFFRVNRLSPREKITFFYLAMLRKTKDIGYPRNKSQTPLEYSEFLHKNFSEAANEITDLTGEFMKARFSNYPIDESEANWVKEIWYRLNKKIRSQKKLK